MIQAELMKTYSQQPFLSCDLVDSEEDTSR